MSVLNTHNCSLLIQSILVKKRALKTDTVSEKWQRSVSTNYQHYESKHVRYSAPAEYQNIFEVRVYKALTFNF